MPESFSYDEEQLIIKISEGDEEAFARLFYHYGAIIHPVILKIVKDEAAAEDVVAEIFLKLWINRKKRCPLLPTFPATSIVWQPTLPSII